MFEKLKEMENDHIIKDEFRSDERLDTTIAKSFIKTENTQDLYINLKSSLDDKFDALNAIC